MAKSLLKQHSYYPMLLSGLPKQLLFANKGPFSFPLWVLIGVLAEYIFTINLF